VRQAVADVGAQPFRNYAYNPRGLGALTPYGTQTLTGAVAVTGAPLGATTATRVAYGSGAITNPGLVFASTDIRQNRPYYVQADVFVESGETDTFNLAYLNQVSQPNTSRPGTLPTGQWTRLAWRFPDLAAADNKSIGIRLASRANAVAGSFLVTNCFVTESENMQATEYADGSYPGWKWLGAAGSSQSVGYPDPLRRPRYSHPAQPADRGPLRLGPGWDHPGALPLHLGPARAVGLPRLS
jgi:hypothetical protein